MNRRDLLKTGAAAVASMSGLGVSTAGAQGAKPNDPMLVRNTTSVMLWTLKGTLEEKLAISAKAGIQSLELVGEYDPWQDAEIAQTKKLCRDYNLKMDTLIGTPEWGKRPVSMLDPMQRDAFLADCKRAITYAQRLEIPQIILMSGNTIAEKSYDEQFASLLEGAKRAAELAADSKLTMIIEPLNSLVNHKGYFLNNCKEGLRLVKAVDNPHVRLLFDIYHEQVQEGNVIRMLTEAAPYVAVFHVADNPGRNDPGTGEINYANVYKAIRKTGYTGYLTMEYLPLGDQVESLSKALKGFSASAAA